MREYGRDEAGERLAHGCTDKELAAYVDWLVPRYEDGVTEVSFSCESQGAEAFGMVFLSCEMHTTDVSELRGLRDRLVVELDKYIAHLISTNTDDDSEAAQSP